MRPLSLLFVFLGCSAPGTRLENPGAGPVDAATPAVAAPFDVTLFERERISSMASAPNFQRARATLVLDGGSFASVKLVTQLDTTCFPFTSWANNPPPAGHNWPADCDAFDRNYEWRLKDPSVDGGAPLELLRAITPFGGPMRVETDVTDVFNAVSGTRELEVVIPTWSDGAGRVSGSNGGWFVTATLAFTPGTAPRRLLAVMPLLARSLGPTDKSQRFAFDTPPGAREVVVEYRATGHGGPTSNAPGCFGPAEEFCNRVHTLRGDGQVLDMRVLSRTNCASLCTLQAFPTPNGGSRMACAENPCGLPASVRASRANWCPGSVTEPVLVTTPAWNRAGPHEFAFDIADIAQGGSWVVSATVFVYGN